jgi:hypothetical protein
LDLIDPDRPLRALVDGGSRHPALGRGELASGSTIPDAALRSVILDWINRDFAGFTSFLDELEVDDDGQLWAKFGPIMMSLLPDVSDEVASPRTTPPKRWNGRGNGCSATDSTRRSATSRRNSPPRTPQEPPPS